MATTAEVNALERCVRNLDREFRANVWCEHLAFDSLSDSAARRQALEMRREVGSGWRAVVLIYADQVMDLVIVAHESIDAIRELLLGRAENLPEVQCSPDHSHRLEVLQSADLDLDLRWACNVGAEPVATRLISRHPIDDVDRVRMVAATGLAAAAFCRAEMPVIAVLYGGREGAAALVPVDTRRESSADLLRSVEEWLRCPIWHTGEPNVHIAVVENGRSSAYPLTLEATRDATGEYRLICRSAGNGQSAASLQHFVDAVSSAYSRLTTATHLREISLGGTWQVTHSAPRDQVDAARLDELITRVATGAAATKDAIVCGDRRITYRDLNVQTESLAYALLARGVRRGDRIGIVLERGVELILVMLACWKAGASYVPMDVRSPIERMRYMSTDAGVRLLVCDQNVVIEAMPSVAIHVSELCAAPERTPPVSVGAATDEAYVIYTSGSTGKPKGVSVPHGNVAALMRATAPEFGLSEHDVWTFFHSPAFDFSVWEIWGCLLTGGTLVVVPYEISRDPAAFQRLLIRERVTVLSQTPSAFEPLIEVYRRNHIADALRLVVLGGESLNPRILLLWFDTVPESECSVVNMYGITETTVHVTAEIMTRRHALTRSACVGRPIAGWQVWVVDSAGNPLPPGAVGEIWVGGAGVANGYLNQPELTRERFVVVPGIAGRLYRSGDRGRLTADGRLEHLGRLDSQIKLRGFRIEIEEIRAVLLATPGVERAAVVLTHRVADDPGTAQLAAFVVLSEADVEEVKRHLRRVLPDYMVPAVIVAVTALPITPNGKLDVSCLAQLSGDAADRTMPAGSATDLCGLVRGAFSAVLGVSAGEHDNFFDLGGNSLSAIRVAAHLQRHGVTAISPGDLYRNQTSAELAQVLSASHAAGCRTEGD